MAPLHRLSAEHAARHRERSVVAEIACTDTHQIDLPHQLIVRTQQKVILRKLIQRRKFRHTGCRYNRIHRPDGLVQFLDGIGGADIYPKIAELVPTLTTSCRSDSYSTTARPIVPVSPITITFIMTFLLCRTLTVATAHTAPSALLSRAWGHDEHKRDR